MKTNFKLLLVSLLILAGCSPSYMGSSSAYEDDIYYSPGDAPLVVQEVRTIVKPTTPEAYQQTRVEPTATPPAQEPIVTKTEPINIAVNTNSQDFTPFQERYADLLADDSVESLDTVVYENQERGYYLDEFKGSEIDMRDAERMRSYYPTGFGYFYGDGYNTAMMLAGDPDWNVYVEGNYVWWTPTWTNIYFYNDFRFHPYRFGRMFAYGYNYNYAYSSPRLSVGWNYPLWDMYFDWYQPGYGYSYYGYPYYGYNYYGHNYYGYPYYRYHHHHHSHGHYNSDNYYYGHRSSVGSKSMHYNRSKAVVYSRRSSINNNNNSAATTYSRRSSTKSSAVAPTRVTSRRSNRTGYTGSRSQAASRYSTRSANSRYSTGKANTQSRSTYIRRGSSSTKSQAVSPQTRYRNSYTAPRRSNVPSYSTPRTSTRPTYNRTGTYKKSSSVNSRSYTRPNTKTYRNSRSTGYSRIKSGTSFKKGSSKSSGSSIRNSSSSNYKSSRSSGSSYRSSSSSRSSGSVSSSRSSGSSSRGTTRSSGTRSKRR